MTGCSSFTFKTRDEKHLLSRTMDFELEMAEQVVFIPREKKLKTSYLTQGYIVAKYCCLGMGKVTDDDVVLYDGINEKGLMGATLYFPGFAHYFGNKSDKKSVSPDKIISLILTLASSLEDIRDIFENKIEIDSENNPTINLLPPLHYIFSDRTGKSLIIEPSVDGLQIIEDSIGVMTNSPHYRWHELNLINYLGISDQQHSSIQFLEKKLIPFGLGTGTLGLPGDFTPPSRFIRVAMLKNFSERPTDEIAGVTLCHHILESVSVPKGIVKAVDSTVEFTCYTSTMCSESLKYYFSTYNNQQIRCITIDDSLKQVKDFKLFFVNDKENILYLN